MGSPLHLKARPVPPAPPLKSATLIYNPIAGRRPARREKEVREAAAILRESSIEVKLVPTSGPGLAGELARSAVRQGESLILVCGGDGTLNEVINGVASSQATLGILPGGTANIAAKELGLPRSPVGAVRELGRWSARRVALGRAIWSEKATSAGVPGRDIRRRYFFSVAGVGFDAYIVHKLTVGLKTSAGVAGYIFEALRQVFRYSFPRFACDLDGRTEEGTFAIIHRTSRYAGWLHTAPRADFFQPRLTLCLFKSPHRARYFLYAAAVVARQHPRLCDVSLVETSEARFSSAARVPVYFELDGELAGRLPVTFEVVPDALTVLAP